MVTQQSIRARYITHNLVEVQDSLEKSWGTIFKTLLEMCIVVVVLYMCCYLMCICCTFFFTLDAGLLARSQYSEGPATGQLDTGFYWFPCV